jgi:putative polyhydroxyalkanoate system protein
MSQIRVHHAHGMTQKKAKGLATRVAAKLEQEFDLTGHWVGNTLTFERTGLSGTLVVSAHAIDIEIELGMLLGMLKSRIESELRTQLDTLFGAV